MGLAAALWDDLAKAANLAQMSGLHAVMLVAVGASLLRIPHGRRECAKLERRSRRLRAMLQWPTGCGAALLRSEMGDSVVKALVDAAGLVESYNKSTLWRRVRRGRSMANQLRDTRDVVDSYCVLLLFINAHSLSQQATHHPPLTIHEVNDPMQSPSVQSVSNCPKVTATCDAQRANNDIVGEGGANNTCSQTDKTDQAGCERSLLACYTDFPCISVQGRD